MLGNSDVTLWAVFGVSAILFWYVGKSFISQPNYNVPLIFRTPLVGKMLFFLPQIGFLTVSILGFVLTDNGWWFLGAVITALILLSPKQHSF